MFLIEIALKKRKMKNFSQQKQLLYQINFNTRPTKINKTEFESQAV